MMWNQLIDAGDPRVEILYASTVEERPRELLAQAETTPDRSVISHRLWRLYD